MNMVALFMDEIYNIFVNRNSCFDEEATKLFEKLNQECTQGQEFDLQNVILSYKHLHKGELLEAILAVDKILLNKTFDPHSRNKCRSLLLHIHSEFVDLAKANISDQRIGQVFEALWVRGVMGVDGQTLVASHYEAVGDTEKATMIRNRITKVFPNYLTRKAG